MKTKHLITALLLAGSHFLYAQAEFKKEWETKAKVENKWNSCNADLSMVLMGDLESFSMIDGTNGKILWTCVAKEKFGVKEVDNWSFLWAKEGDPVEVIYKKKKEKTTTTVYLDPRTGEVKSSFTESDLVDKKDKIEKTKGKTLFADEAYDPNSTTWVEVGYDDKKVKSAAGGTDMDLTIIASGGNTWKTKITAKCVRHLCDIMLSSNEPEMMVNVMIAQEKVFVVYEGITVLDLKTGTVLWNTSFDNIKTSVGLKASQEIGRCAMPVATVDAVYICDLSKGERAVKKLDINTGKLIWKGDKLSNDDIVSQLFVYDNNLIVKFGGVIRTEKFIPNANGGVGDGVYKVEYTYEGNSEIRAYDTQTGKQTWTSVTAFKEEKLNKSECSVMLDENKLIVCSDKSFMIIDAKTGSRLSTEDLGSKQIGKAQYLFMYDDHFIVEGNEGIASFTKQGKKVYATSTDKRLMSEFRHDAYIVWVGKEMDDMNEFVRFDLTTGKVLGSLKGCYRPRFDQTGDYFIRFNDQTVTKYKTKM
jgi:outer membrane protein assembly factor BamB